MVVCCNGEKKCEKKRVKLIVYHFESIVTDDLEPRSTKGVACLLSAMGFITSCITSSNKMNHQSKLHNKAFTITRMAHKQTQKT